MHYNKPGWVAVDVAAAISAETATLLAGNGNDLEESNLFASDKDLEDNETTIDNN